MANLCKSFSKPRLHGPVKACRSHSHVRTATQSFGGSRAIRIVCEEKSENRNRNGHPIYACPCSQKEGQHGLSLHYIDGTANKPPPPHHFRQICPESLRIGVGLIESTPSDAPHSESSNINVQILNRLLNKSLNEIDIFSAASRIHQQKLVKSTVYGVRPLLTVARKSMAHSRFTFTFIRRYTGGPFFRLCHPLCRGIRSSLF